MSGTTIQHTGDGYDAWLGYRRVAPGERYDQYAVYSRIAVAEKDEIIRTAVSEYFSLRAVNLTEIKRFFVLASIGI